EQVGMVVRRLAEEADQVHQHQRGGPAVGGVLAPDGVLVLGPASEMLEPPFQVGSGIGLFSHEWPPGSNRGSGRAGQPACGSTTAYVAVWPGLSSTSISSRVR